MERIIKFRVWDKLAQVFIYPDSGYQGHFVLSLKGEFTNLQNGVGKSEVIVQQFTGLLDKNGKEIYEGDILKCLGHDGWFDQIGHDYNLVVKHKILPSGDSETSGFVYIPKDREIIGNIFENPDLLP